MVGSICTIKVEPVRIRGEHLAHARIRSKRNKKHSIRFGLDSVPYIDYMRVNIILAFFSSDSILFKLIFELLSKHLNICLY